MITQNANARFRFNQLVAWKDEHYRVIGDDGATPPRYALASVVDGKTVVRYSVPLAEIFSAEKNAVVCAWCDTVMSGEVEKDAKGHLKMWDINGQYISHGICQDCYAEFQSDLQNP